MLGGLQPRTEDLSASLKWKPPGAARLRRRVTTHWRGRCAVAPSGGQRCWLLLGFGGHLGGGLVPPGDPQSQATLSSPAPRAQGGLLDGAPEAPKGPGGQFSARADDKIIHMRWFGTRQASAKPLPATPPPPPFRTRPCPTDACLRAVLQVWLSTIFRRARRASDAPVHPQAWGN